MYRTMCRESCHLYAPTTGAEPASDGKSLRLIGACSTFVSALGELVCASRASSVSICTFVPVKQVNCKNLLVPALSCLGLITLVVAAAAAAIPCAAFLSRRHAIARARRNRSTRPCTPPLASAFLLFFCTGKASKASTCSTSTSHRSSPAPPPEAPLSARIRSAAVPTVGGITARSVRSIPPSVHTIRRRARRRRAWLQTLKQVLAFDGAGDRLVLIFQASRELQRCLLRQCLYFGPIFCTSSVATRV